MKSLEDISKIRSSTDRTSVDPQQSNVGTSTTTLLCRQRRRKQLLMETHNGPLWYGRACPTEFWDALIGFSPGLT